MRATQHIFRVRREYNIWVGNQTLEDYALRFTAKKSRQFSIDQVAKTALGATAFMALEAIAAAVTLNYGFSNFVFALLTVSAVIFITGLPIGYYAAKYGLDIDLLTRGAGFGYLGSTITSLIYASFTFIFFAIEAAILASALQALLGIPLAVGYVLSAVAVVPIVTHGITAISRFQIGTQSLWLGLQLAALAVVVWFELGRIDDWSRYEPAMPSGNGGFNLVLFGTAASILFAMICQIGEQVDYLRFLPPKTAANSRRWWFWMILAGPGWIIIGIIKMLFGSFLAYLAISAGTSMEQAVDPTYMYQMAFIYLTQSPSVALLLAGIMVVMSQMKINVTNAYAGSIAWSNFFSRLTHSHPGRVVWLVFNVAIALILMELGMYRALEAILGVFAIVALAWLGCLSADLMINKPLGLSPSFVEFKRAHLYDINPVGVFSMLLASVVGIFCYMGWFGETAKYLAHFISLVICFISVPAIAWWTRGRYYLARQSPEIDSLLEVRQITSIANRNETDAVLECCICDNAFEQEDMSYCPAYQGAICSLCCSLDSRCMDSCKPGARLAEQIVTLLTPLFPNSALRIVNSRLAQFLALLTFSNIVIGIMLCLIYFHLQPQDPQEVALLRTVMLTLFFVLLIISGVICWLFLLAHESSVVAQQESSRQTLRLMREIEAHNETDAKLQKAKDLAERANSAKSRYLTGISHELRTPLQSILGYAQLLSQRSDMPRQHQAALQTIRRSGEFLTDLIEGLLDISKIEAGRLDIYRNEVNLREVIDQLVTMFTEQANAKGIEFSCHIHNRLPPRVATDEKRLRQILINLLSNAVKYTEKGSVEFHLRYRNQVAEFSVVDTGVGIHAEDLDRILDPFERVRGPNVPNVPGTGLGLTIVRLLTDIMGGELRITSTPGAGSCFTVSLMFSWLDGAAAQAVPQLQPVGYEGERKVVLVVDDEPIHRGLMFELLSPLGFTVIEAPDVRSCYDILAQMTPDLFLLDVSMPGTDGLVLAEELRVREYRQPVIMISADAQERHFNSKTTVFHDEYLVKPINNQRLLERIGQLLKLQWIHAGDPGEKLPPTGTITQPLSASLPDHPLIRELIAYAEIGYSNGVRAKLDEIEAATLIGTDTMQFLRTLVSSMRFDRLVATLKPDQEATLVEPAP